MAWTGIGRTKILKYRDQLGRPQHEHQNHWAGFEWQAGNIVVSYFGEWGEIQVWAVDEAEGRRVISHACAIAGIPLTGPGRGEWAVGQSSSSRNGKPGTFRTHSLDGSPVVVKRAGPSGPAMV
jgi:hypothetical protein